MPKTPGSGRKKGSRNRLTFDAAEILREAQCNPIVIMAEIAQGKKAYRRSYIDETGASVTREEYPSIDLRAKMAAELARYVQPQLKAIETSTRDPAELVRRLREDPKAREEIRKWLDEAERTKPSSPAVN